MKTTRVCSSDSFVDGKLIVTTSDKEIINVLANFASMKKVSDYINCVIKNTNAECEKFEKRWINVYRINLDFPTETITTLFSSELPKMIRKTVTKDYKININEITKENGFTPDKFAKFLDLLIFIHTPDFCSLLVKRYARYWKQIFQYIRSQPYDKANERFLSYSLFPKIRMIIEDQRLKESSRQYILSYLEEFLYYQDFRDIDDNKISYIEYAIGNDLFPILDVDENRRKHPDNPIFRRSFKLPCDIPKVTSLQRSIKDLREGDEVFFLNKSYAPDISPNIHLDRRRVTYNEEDFTIECFKYNISSLQEKLIVENLGFLKNGDRIDFLGIRVMLIVRKKSTRISDN